MSGLIPEAQGFILQEDNLEGIFRPMCAHCGSMETKNTGGSGHGLYTYTCINCDAKWKQEPHKAFDQSAQFAVAPSTKNKYTCNKCGAPEKKGHLCPWSKKIPVKKPRPFACGKRTNKLQCCVNCGQPGHKKKTCINPPRNTTPAINYTTNQNALLDLDDEDNEDPGLFTPLLADPFANPFVNGPDPDYNSADAWLHASPEGFQTPEPTAEPTSELCQGCLQTFETPIHSCKCHAVRLCNTCFGERGMQINCSMCLINI